MTATVTEQCQHSSAKRDIPDNIAAELEDDGLDAARGIFLAVPIGAAVWTLIGLAIWFLAGCTTVPEAREPQVSCLVDEMNIWLQANYAEAPIVSRPAVSFASQGELQNMLGNAYARGLILGVNYFDQIVLWDLNDMSTLTAQSTLVHEMAHWIDFVEKRSFDHRRVYEVQRRWEIAYWPDGIVTC